MVERNHEPGRDVRGPGGAASTAPTDSCAWCENAPAYRVTVARKSSSSRLLKGEGPALLCGGCARRIEDEGELVSAVALGPVRL